MTASAASERPEQPEQSPPRVTIRNERDALAVVPYVLGFHPQDSLVLLTTSTSDTPFHARIDLPRRPADTDAVVTELLRAVLRNEADHAIVVVYAADADRVGEAGQRLLAGLRGHGVAVALALRADGSRWWRLGDGGPGRAYDLRSHPVTARGVLNGRVTFASRRALEQSLAACDADELARVEAAVLHEQEAGRPIAAEADWLMTRVSRFHRDRAPLSSQELARALTAVAHVPVRDRVWVDMTRARAAVDVALWGDVVRRSPSELAAPPSALLAFASWLAGDGALAWCAVDRALAADPGYRLAELVAHALREAVPPTAWAPPEPGSLEGLEE